MFIAAPVLVCSSPSSAHTMAVHGSAMHDKHWQLVLQRGDCYQGGPGETLRVTIGAKYRLDRNNDGKFTKKRKPGTYKVSRYKSERTVMVRVY